MDSKLKPSPSRLVAIQNAWRNLTSAGPSLTAAERVAVIEIARAAWAGGPHPIDDPLQEAAHWLAADAGGLTGEVVEEFESRGLDRFRYLEVVGVVARLANVDFYMRGIGGALPVAIAADDNPPTGDRAPEAELTDGWVPALGPLMAPFSLDALPAEGDALRAIHEPMYIDMTEIGNGGYADELTKAQIEYIAARTSYLNECFY
ncbi:MAG: hypothetical protein AAF531_16705 [Actinomycetota bacterium]